MSNPNTALIQLRHYYQNIVTQSEQQASQARAQLAHVDALLVNGLLQDQESPALQTTNAPPQAFALPEPASPPPPLPLSAQVEALEDSFAPRALTAAELAEDVEDFLARAKPASSRKTKAASAQQKATKATRKESPQGKRSPRPLLPAYAGLKRLEAIAQVFESTPGQEVTIDTLAQDLFGNLSAVDHKAERKRLNTLLYQGEKRGLWQKGSTPSSYLIGVPETTNNAQSSPKKATAKKAVKTSAAKASSTKTKPEAVNLSTPRLTVALLPDYKGLNKLEAIKKILTEQSGHVLHQNTIFQLLYGDLGPDVLNEESRRMRASLVQGVTKGLWDKASSQPSSYWIKASNGRKP
jgi:hypothetical protein